MAKRGLYANINAKKKRIEAGSGETMRQVGATLLKKQLRLQKEWLLVVH